MWRENILTQYIGDVKQYVDIRGNKKVKKQSGNLGCRSVREGGGIGGFRGVLWPGGRARVVMKRN
jgi:hypothetical protein